MKFFSLFTKIPSHRRFAFTPRYYDAEAEQRKEREERIRREIESEGKDHIPASRLAGAFRSTRKSSRQKDPSASLLRLIILTALSLWLIAIFEFGRIGLYGILIFIPFYFYLRFRGRRK